MRRIVPLLLVFAACAEPTSKNPVSPSLSAPSLAVIPGQRVFRTHLLGTNEVPPNGSPSCGLTFLELFTDRQGNLGISWRTRINNLGGATFVAGHIHGPAAAGAIAGVLVTLYSSQGDASPFIDHKGQAPISTTLAAAIQANPQNYYVNYHTTRIPAGEIRGQLSSVNPPAGMPVCNPPAA